ncbi:MAG: response regulator [Synergistaceae bacterium]|jgi:signal transduction histidine kinase/CheY-like chemotaxis protein|nr:response regulator [Synergistaceae bacterium]
MVNGQKKVSSHIRAILRTERNQILFVFMAFLLMVVASCFFVSRIVEKQIVTNAEEILTTAQVSISASLREAEVTLFNASLSIQNRLDNRHTNEQVGKYITELTNGLLLPTNNISGFLGLFGYVNGSFISGNGWIPPDDFDVKSRPWYIAAQKGRGRVSFSPPHPSARTGRMIVSAAKMLTGAGGEDYGVIALDIDLSGISQYINSLQFAEGGYGMLLDSDLKLVAHPDDGLLGRRLDDISPEHAVIAGSMRKGETDISARKMRGLHETRVIAFFRGMSNGWYIGMVTPMRSYYKDLFLMALILSLLGLILMTMLSCLLIRLSLAKLRSEEENRSKSSFLARMSHEIRTPMNSILGMSELIMRNEISNEVREYISIIHNAGDSLLAIINDILDFSKIESGQLKIEVRKYFFQSLINDMINVIRVRVVERDIDFLVNVDPEIPQQLIGDEVRIRQIVINLLANAVKYTEKGFVCLDVKKNQIDDDTLELVFKVRDSGVGIKKEDLHKLFVDFTRLDVDYNQRVEGTGLGLAIARTYCRLMDGDVSVESEFGRGSTFTATLIQTFEEDKKLAAVKHPEQKRVLLYEDRPMHLQSIVAEMKALGVTPACSLSLAEFVEDLEEGDFDYAFVSSTYAMDCIDALGRRRMPIQLVVMVEPGEVSAFRDVGSIMMPVYSVQIANALNGVIERGAGSPDGNASRFIVPEARVLIVDDILSNLRVAKELVAQYRAVIDTCKSGSEAIELVKNNHYDIVFMDHMMPDMDGLQTTAVIRRIDDGSDYYRSLPIVALTANAISGQREMFLQNGMDDFLAKPIEMQQLDGILQRWIPKEKQVELAPGEETPEPAAEDDAPDAPLEVPGINVSVGLKHIGGSMAVYKDILSDFCADAKELIEKIKHEERTGDIHNYTIHVHAMKGAARSIGAAEFALFAAQMEEAGHNGNLELIHERTDDLLKNLGELVDNIFAALMGEEGPYSEGGDEDGAEDWGDVSDLNLEALKTALENLDIETVNDMLINYVTMPLDPGTKKMVSKIEQHILMFEYEDAIEKIDRALG